MPHAVAVGIYIAGLAVALAIGATRPARSQTFCAPWPIVKKTLENAYREVVVSRGEVNGQTAIVVTASPDGASFTVLLVAAGGQACILSAGRGWEPGTNPTAEKNL
jgi:Na+(H+)/acetate symporter ActP